MESRDEWEDEAWVKDIRVQQSWEWTSKGSMQRVWIEEMRAEKLESREAFVCLYVTA